MIKEFASKSPAQKNERKAFFLFSYDMKIDIATQDIFTLFQPLFFTFVRTWHIDSAMVMTKEITRQILTRLALKVVWYINPDDTVKCLLN